MLSFPRRRRGKDNRRVFLVLILHQINWCVNGIIRLYNIWNDVFFDSCDVHKVVKNANKYGPVCFVFSVDLLDDKSLPPIRITKTNPFNWNKSLPDNIEDNYIDDISEYKKVILPCTSLLLIVTK